MTGTPCPRRQRWAQVTCPLDRGRRSLLGMWLATYLDQRTTHEVARGLALATCRALYPETFRTTTAELGPRPEEVPDV